MRGIAGLDGWRWIFIIVNFSASVVDAAANVLLKEGLMTVVASIPAYFFIYNYPATAEFLTSKEREYLIAQLKQDGDAVQDEEFSWGGVRKALKDPKVYLYGLCFHTVSLPVYTLSLFLPTIIKDLGYTAAQAQLLSTPPYVFAFFLTMAVAVIAEKMKRRAAFIIASSTLAIVGYILIIISLRPGQSYAGTVLAAGGIYCGTALILSWPANNVSGQTKRATASAMQISIGNLGAIIGTQLYRTEWGPRYFIGHGVVRQFATHLLYLNWTLNVCTLGYGLPRRKYCRRKHLVVRPRE